MTRLTPFVTLVWLLATATGCAFEANSVGPDNGGLGVEAAEPGLPDSGLSDVGTESDINTDMGATDTSTADATAPDDSTSGTTLPGTSSPDKLEPSGSTDAVIEPLCTPATERSSCPGTSCDPETLTCTSMMLASRNTCQTCFSDSNCARADHRCVTMTYEGKPFPDTRTGFCLRIAEPTTVDGGYACDPPFSVPLIDRISRSGGTNQSYCGIHESLTTCFAVQAFHSEEMCPSGRDDECPVGGLCRGIVSGKKTEYACTYACIEASECSSMVAKTSCAGFCGG